MINQLPIVEIDGKHYFQDDRLREYRAVSNPNERIKFDDTGSRKIKVVSEAKELLPKHRETKSKGRFI